MTNALLAAIQARKAATSSADTIKPKDGRNRYRILPSWRKVENAPSELNDNEKAEWAAQFWHDFGQHFVKGADGKVKAVYVCVDKTFGRPCPICGEIARGMAETSDDDQIKVLKESNASGRVLLNVLELSGPTPDKPQVLELAPSAFNGNKGVGGIISLFADYPDLVDLETGTDVIIEKQGKGLDTKYGVTPVRGAPVNPNVMNSVKDLDLFVRKENATQQQRALAAVSVVTGLLPAPTAPSLTDAAAAVFASKPAAAPTASVAEDLPDFPTAAAPAPAPVQAPAPAPAPATTTAEDDMEAMLKDLGI